MLARFAKPNIRRERAENLSLPFDWFSTLLVSVWPISPIYFLLFPTNKCERYLRCLATKLFVSKYYIYKKHCMSVWGVFGDWRKVKIESRLSIDEMESNSSIKNWSQKISVLTNLFNAFLNFFYWYNILLFYFQLIWCLLKCFVYRGNAVWKWVIKVCKFKFWFKFWKKLTYNFNVF